MILLFSDDDDDDTFITNLRGGWGSNANDLSRTLHFIFFFIYRDYKTKTKTLNLASHKRAIYSFSKCTVDLLRKIINPST